MAQYVEERDSGPHGELVHFSPTCGQDSRLNTSGSELHTKNANLQTLLRLLETIMNKRDAKLIVVENVKGKCGPTWTAMSTVIVT